MALSMKTCIHLFTVFQNSEITTNLFYSEGQNRNVFVLIGSVRFFMFLILKKIDKS